MGAGSSVGTPVSASSKHSLESRTGYHPPVVSPTSIPSPVANQVDLHVSTPQHTSIEHSSSPPQGRLYPPLSPPPSPLPLTEEQREKVYNCLSTLESALEECGVHFNVEDIIAGVVVVTQGGEEEEDEEGSVLTHGRESGGIFVLDEGTMEVSSPDGKTTLYRLLPGDFFGEMSTLFKVQYTSNVKFINRVTLLQLPSSVILHSMEGGEMLGRGAMLEWCIKKSMFDSSGVFESSDMAQRVLARCFKCSLLLEISDEAIEYIASLTKPVLYDEGDTLYSVGDDPCYIYFVLRGQVERYSASGDLLEPMRYVRFSDEGFSIGGGQFFRGEKLPHAIRAAGPVLVAPVGRETLLEMTNEYPSEVTKLKDLLERYRNS